MSAMNGSRRSASSGATRSEDTVSMENGDQDATCFNCAKHKKNVDRLMQMIQNREVYHETEMKAKRTAVDNMLKAQQEMLELIQERSSTTQQPASSSSSARTGGRKQQGGTERRSEDEGPVLSALPAKLRPVLESQLKRETARKGRMNVLTKDQAVQLASEMLSLASIVLLGSEAFKDGETLGAALGGSQGVKLGSDIATVWRVCQEVAGGGQGPRGEASSTTGRRPPLAPKAGPGRGSASKRRQEQDDEEGGEEEDEEEEEDEGMDVESPTNDNDGRWHRVVEVHKGRFLTEDGEEEEEEEAGEEEEERQTRREEEEEEQQQQQHVRELEAQLAMGQRGQQATHQPARVAQQARQQRPQSPLPDDEEASVLERREGMEEEDEEEEEEASDEGNQVVVEEVTPMEVDGEGGASGRKRRRSTTPHGQSEAAAQEEVEDEGRREEAALRKAREAEERERRRQEKAPMRKRSSDEGEGEGTVTRQGQRKAAEEAASSVAKSKRGAALSFLKRLFAPELLADIEEVIMIPGAKLDTLHDYVRRLGNLFMTTVYRGVELEEVEPITDREELRALLLEHGDMLCKSVDKDSKAKVSLSRMAGLVRMKFSADKKRLDDEDVIEDEENEASQQRKPKQLKKAISTRPNLSGSSEMHASIEGGIPEYKDTRSTRKQPARSRGKKQKQAEEEEEEEEEEEAADEEQQEEEAPPARGSEEAPTRRSGRIPKRRQRDEDEEEQNEEQRQQREAREQEKKGKRRAELERDGGAGEEEEEAAEEEEAQQQPVATQGLRNRAARGSTEPQAAADRTERQQQAKSEGAKQAGKSRRETGGGQAGKGWPRRASYDPKDLPAALVDFVLWQGSGGLRHMVPADAWDSLMAERAEAGTLPIEPQPRHGLHDRPLAYLQEVQVMLHEVAGLQEESMPDSMDDLRRVVNKHKKQLAERADRDMDKAKRQKPSSAVWAWWYLYEFCFPDAYDKIPGRHQPPAPKFAISTKQQGRQAQSKRSSKPQARATPSSLASAGGSSSSKSDGVFDFNEDEDEEQEGRLTKRSTAGDAGRAQSRRRGQRAEADASDQSDRDDDEEEVEEEGEEADEEEEDGDDQEEEEEENEGQRKKRKSWKPRQVQEPDWDEGLSEELAELMGGRNSVQKFKPLELEDDPLVWKLLTCYMDFGIKHRPKHFAQPTAKTYYWRVRRTVLWLLRFATSVPMAELRLSHVNKLVPKFEEQLKEETKNKRVVTNVKVFQEMVDLSQEAKRRSKKSARPAPERGGGKRQKTEAAAAAASERGTSATVPAEKPVPEPPALLTAQRKSSQAAVPQTEAQSGNARATRRSTRGTKQTEGAGEQGPEGGRRVDRPGVADREAAEQEEMEEEEEEEEERRDPATSSDQPGDQAETQQKEPTQEEGEGKEGEGAMDEDQQQHNDEGVRVGPLGGQHHDDEEEEEENAATETRPHNHDDDMYLDQPDDTPDLIVHDDFNPEPQPHDDQTLAQPDKDSGGGHGHDHSQQQQQQQQAWLAHAGAPPASLDAPPMGLLPCMPQQQLTAGGQPAVSAQQGRGPMMMASHALVSGFGALTSLIGGRPSQQQHYTEQSGGQHHHHQPSLLGPGVGQDAAAGTATSGGDMMDVDSQQQPQQSLLLGPLV